jgi:hypothetical protein
VRRALGYALLLVTSWLGVAFGQYAGPAILSSVSQLPAIAASTFLCNSTAGTAAPTACTLGANVATALGTPSSANLAAAVTDETGTGSLMFAINPVEGSVHQAAFSVTTNTSLASISGLSQALTASGTYSCNGFMHFTTASTTSNGVKVALATSDTLTITTLNFTAIGFNGAAFATSGTGTATALGSTAVNSLQAYTDIILQGIIVVNAAGTLQVQIAENTSSGTIAGNARWECHRAA